MKTPITYWGGKQVLAASIVSNIPEHVTYCEPFFGGGAVFFAKPKSKVEIINDLNQEVINFYRQAQCNFPALQKRVQSTPHSRRLYKDIRPFLSSSPGPPIPSFFPEGCIARTLRAAPEV